MANIQAVLEKLAEGVVNPSLYDPMKKKYQSHLTTGLPLNTSAAPSNKVLPSIQV